MQAILSWARLQHYRSCPRRYAYRYLQKLYHVSASNMHQRGELLHAALHRHALGLATPEREDPEYAHIWQRYLETIAPYVGAWQRSEWELRVPDEGAWLMGRCDRVYWQSGVLTLLDWKTGQSGPSEESEEQLRFYAWLLYLSRVYLPGEVNCIEARALWLETGEQVELVWQPDNLLQEAQRFRPWIEACLALSEMPLPQPRSIGGRIWCTLCEYQRLCPEGINYAPGYERPDLPV